MKLDKLEDAISLNKKYNVIYADPPWDYDNKKNCDPRMGGITYDIMTLAEIKSMGEIINKIAEKDCALFLWATLPKIQEALDVINAWGFNYRTCAFTWVKLNPSEYIGGDYGTDKGRELEKNYLKATSFYSGLGHWTNGNAELCLFAKKGSPKRKVKNIKQIVLAPRSKHSEKPVEVRDRIEKLIVGNKKIELFCRGTGGDGWDIWGNESEVSICE